MTEPMRSTKMQAANESVAIQTVRRYFESNASFWQAIYSGEDVYSVIHQERRAIVLSLSDQLRIPPGSEVLEIGCGAGSTAVALAKRGYAVTATDLAESMLELTRQSSEAACVKHLIRTRQCDVYQLPFPDNSFELVLAIGVLPWLPSLMEPMREMVRVLRPGGSLIVTTDNRWRMTHLLNPMKWMTGAAKWVAGRRVLPKLYKGPSTALCSVRQFDDQLPSLGLEKLWGTTLGFGPFWFTKGVLPLSLNVRLHHAMQRMADGGVPVFRSTGAQYITVSTKLRGLDGER